MPAVGAQHDPDAPRSGDAMCEARRTTAHTRERVCLGRWPIRPWSSALLGILRRSAPDDLTPSSSATQTKAVFTSGQLILARYALDAPIGQGSMAGVWQAEDLILKRQ